VFVIRGDLTNATGYGQATRSLAAILRKRFELYGVDLHPEAGASRSIFPGQLVDDNAVLSFCNRADTHVIVLNYTIPDYFRYFLGATNIGSFYWETSAIPFPLKWREMIASMDFMWAPSKYNADLIFAAGFRRLISIITWPHDFCELEHSSSLGSHGLSVQFIDEFNGSAGAEIELFDLRKAAENLFLSVKSMAPRKGLPVLLTEWRDYVAESAHDDILLLKLRLIHNSNLGSSVDPGYVISNMIREAGWRQGDRTRIAYTVQNLSNEEMEDLYGWCDCYVTASYGEGFGGPVVEALLLGKPVIASIHTGMGDLLRWDYPLAFLSDPKHVELRGNSQIYPHASTWHVPRRGELCGAFRRFAAMDAAERTAAVRMGRAHAEAFCSEEAVSAQLESFFSQTGLGS
jgi:glycosyltransferase involved in cell wall biosynthesis